ncbi:MAG: hypothetical protein AAGJ81_14790 [Verrucomicrobiota bacterium]
MKLTHILILAVIGIALSLTSATANPDAFFPGELIDHTVTHSPNIDNHQMRLVFSKSLKSLPSQSAVETRRIVNREDWTWLGITFRTKHTAFALPQSEIDLLVEIAKEEAWSDRKILEVLRGYDRTQVWKARRALGVDYFVPHRKVTSVDRIRTNRRLNGQIANGW